MLGTFWDSALVVEFQAVTSSAFGLGDESQSPGEKGKPFCGEPGTETKLVLKAGKEAAATGPQLPSVIGLCVLAQSEVTGHVSYVYQQRKPQEL